MTPAMKCACPTPTCRTVLQIAQALPARVKCPKCGVIFTVAAPPGTPAPSGVRPAPGAAPARTASSTAVQPAPAAAPMLLPRERPRRKKPYKPAGGGRGVLTVVLIGLVVLIGGGVLAAVFLANQPPATKDNDKDDPSTRDGKKTNPLNPLSPKDAETVKAIDKGVGYLRAQILGAEKKYYYPDRQPGSDVGVSALAGLTLLECGIPPSDAAVEKVYKYVHDNEKQLTFTYSLSLCVLFLDRIDQARGDKTPRAKELQAKDRDAIQRLTVRLLAAQKAIGGWDYTSPVLPPDQEKNLLAAFKKGEPFHPVPSDKDRDDNSINQFVTLALWTARRHEIKTDYALLRIDQRYRDNQNKDGSWGYMVRDDNLKDATTCAGLIGLAVGQAVKNDAAVDKGKKPGKNVLKDDDNINRGMKYLGGAFGRPKSIPAKIREERHRDAAVMLVHIKQIIKLREARDQEKDPEALEKIDQDLNKAAIALTKLDQPHLLKGTYFAADAWGDLYFLWSVERVAMVYDLKKIANLDWYDWGRDFILPNQKPNGSWEDRFPGIPDTCFALLFLKRANVVKDLTDKLRGLLAGANAAVSPGPNPTPPVPARKDE